MEGLGPRSQDFCFGAVALETAVSGPSRRVERQDQIPGKGQPSHQMPEDGHNGPEEVQQKENGVKPQDSTMCRWGEEESQKPRLPHMML